MQKSTKDTSIPTNVGASGLPKRLPPWVIAAKFLRTASGQSVDVEHATDADFQQFVEQHKIPVDDSGIAAWSFDDRCRTINFALRKGIVLELFDSAETASEAG